MPIYEFHCNACGQDYESISKPYEPVVCPHCRVMGESERKITAHGSYQIKGNNSASTRPKGG